MKSILFIIACLALALPCFADNHKPVVRNGYVMRTIQQDAELKDWIAGMVKTSQANQAVADDATKRASELQTNIDALAVRANDAEIRLKKMTDARDFWRGMTFKVGIPLALLSLALGLWAFRKPLLALASL